MKPYTAEKDPTEEYTLVVPEDCLRFESRFESGNLRKAIQIGDAEYNLLLEYDTETQAHTQWFYFSVKGASQGLKVRFNVVNLMKHESLYNNGLIPLSYSVQTEKWAREAFSISYYRNSLPKATTSGAFYFTLTFCYVFKESSDTVYFAHCFPYTYPTLMHDIRTLALRHPSIFRLDSLCTTLGGNDCPCLTITQNIDSYQSWPDELAKLTKTSAARRLLRAREERQVAQQRHIELYRKAKLVGGRD